MEGFDQKGVQKRLKKITQTEQDKGRYKIAYFLRWVAKGHRDVSIHASILILSLFQDFQFVVASLWVLILFFVYWLRVFWVRGQKESELHYKRERQIGG